MAKTRKTSRKTGARKKTTRRPARATAARKVELRPIRKQIEAEKKRLRGAEQTREVKNAIKRLDRCLAEIRAICGPNMMIPLA